MRGVLSRLYLVESLRPTENISPMKLTELPSLFVLLEAILLPRFTDEATESPKGEVIWSHRSSGTSQASVPLLTLSGCLVFPSSMKITYLLILSFLSWNPAGSLFMAVRFWGFFFAVAGVPGAVDISGILLCRGAYGKIRTSIRI